MDGVDTINDVPNEEDKRDDHEGDQGGVAQVLHVDVLVLVVQLQTSRCKVEVVPIVSVPVKSHYILQKTFIHVHHHWQFKSAISNVVDGIVTDGKCPENFICLLYLVRYLHFTPVSK